MRTQVFFLTTVMFIVSVLVWLTGCTGRMVEETPADPTLGSMSSGGDRSGPCDSMSLQGYKSSGTVQDDHTVYCF